MTTTINPAVASTTVKERLAERTFYKVIVFCSNPLIGKFRFNDLFQIYPLKSEYAPTSGLVKFYPVVLEYHLGKIEAEPVPKGLEDVAQELTLLKHNSNVQKEILNLLSIISNYHFFVPDVMPQWFINLDESKSKDEIDSQVSQPGLNIYTYPQLQAETKITTFSTVDYPNVELVQHQDYYSHFGLDVDEVVKFPEHIDATIHKYYTVVGEEYEAVISAIAQIVNGIDLRDRMKSLSFLSFVSSIETMVNFENKNVQVDSCKSCGQPMFKVMSKFREYIFKYGIDNDKLKKEVDKIYSLRSKMVHAGLLLLNDNLIDWGNDKQHTAEWHIHMSLMHLSRLTLVNWMLLKNSIK